MSDPDPLNPHKMFLIRHAIQAAMAADKVAQRLEETTVKYIVLANAGGIVACLGIEGALVGGKAGSAPSIPFSAVAGPMWFFLAGLMFGGLIVSLQRARAVATSEQQGRDALRILRETGRIVPSVESAFSPMERKGVPHITLAINVLGIISQFSFVIGAIWGLVRISSVP
jgi:hypothetical protein